MNVTIAVLLFAGFLALCLVISFIIACRQVTKTHHFFSFAFDAKYWCLSVLNHQYLTAREKGQGTKEFIKEFSHTFLAPSSRDYRKLRLNEESRTLIMKVLSDPSFLESYFVSPTYDRATHMAILTRLQTK